MEENEKLEFVRLDMELAEARAKISDLESQLYTMRKRLTDAEKVITHQETILDKAVTDNKMLHCYITNRQNRIQLPANQSKIDLFESAETDGHRKKSERTKNDFALIIYAMYKAGMFVTFDEDIKTVSDLKTMQTKAKLKDVFDAFGNAVNIANFGGSNGYNTCLQNMKEENCKQLPTDIFDRLKQVIDDLNRKK